MTFFTDAPQRMKISMVGKLVWFCVGWMEGCSESAIGEEGESNHGSQRQRWD